MYEFYFLNELIADYGFRFYTEFENNFRGSREQIINVLSNYDGLIDYILDSDSKPSLLDIGSGRGDWIQKCNAKGFKSIGLEPVSYTHLTLPTNREV